MRYTETSLRMPATVLMWMPSVPRPGGTNMYARGVAPLNGRRAKNRRGEPTDINSAPNAERRGSAKAINAPAVIPSPRFVRRPGGISRGIGGGAGTYMAGGG